MRVCEFALRGDHGGEDGLVEEGKVERGDIDEGEG